MKEAYSTADPGTQTRAVPERAKIHRTYSLFNVFDDVLAAQMTCGSIFTSVANGRDTPRLKDCPGLGDPNTLK